MRRSFLAVVVLAVLGTLALLLSVGACGGEPFDPQSKVSGVRMFGVRADKPYAKPGDTVNLEVLLTDGRAEKPRPLRLYWIPIVCMNPANDLYYLCFAGGAAATLVPAGPPGDGGAGDAGAGVALDADAGGGGPLASIPTGVDLSPFLPQGNTFSFRMPDDAIKTREGAQPYGLAILFNMACAGQVRFVQPDPRQGPQQLPLQCTDEAGTPLPPSDWVLGISRVYAYADRANANPIVERITLGGVEVDPTVGITVEPCRERERINCKENELDVRVADASWEEAPTQQGELLHEQLWVSWFSDIGEIDVEARLLFDTRKGRPAKTSVAYRAPATTGAGTLWGVVHDSRGGQTFITLPLNVRTP